VILAADGSVYAAPYVQRGIEALRHNEFVAAIADFDFALRFTPDDPYAHWNKATALLSLGDYLNGFVEHDWGWRLFSRRGYGPVGEDIDRLQALPLWHGETNVRLLLYHELGFGDAIMCLRFLPEIKRRAAIVLVIDEALARLARSFEIAVVTQVPRDLAAFDVRLPLFGAMKVLHLAVDDIPAAPYIRWRRRDGNEPPCNIGIAWSGRTQRMFSLEAFRALLDHDGFCLYSLQPGATAHGIEPLPPGCDFTDVAARIAAMDHVVTVDTAAAHLAGAMGHPSTHLVLPHMMDWRWWQASAWYPRLKTYRQTSADDWSVPFAQVNEALVRQPDMFVKRAEPPKQESWDEMWTRPFERAAE
jgi:hypothetical protein